MTIEEAWEIIEACKNWNASQKSLSLAFGGVRTAEDDIYDARRSALAQAWRVVAVVLAGLRPIQGRLRDATAIP